MALEDEQVIQNAARLVYDKGNIGIGIVLIHARIDSKGYIIIFPSLEAIWYTLIQHYSPLFSRFVFFGVFTLPEAAAPKPSSTVPLLLFNIFFAAVLTVVLRRFGEGTVILAELVHLNEPQTSMGPEPAMDYTFVVRCGACCTRMTPG